MIEFLKHSGWIIILTIIVLIGVFFCFRIYQIRHLDYRWEKRRHFPQWTKLGIITRDNYLLHTDYHLTETSQYMVIGIHSLGTDSEDFKKAKNFFQTKNISFLSFDQRGFGENQKWKYHTLATTINDIQDIIYVLKERNPNQKIILLGESFGAALVALAAKKLQNEISGVILTNFITKKHILTRDMRIKLQKMVGFCFHKHTNISFTMPVDAISSSADYITLDQDRKLKQQSYSFLFISQAQQLNRQVVKNINNSRVPSFIIQTGQDYYADYQQVTANQKTWKSQVTYKFYQEGYHAILNEPNFAVVLQDCYDWVQQQIK